MILGLDKIGKLLFSYARDRLKSAASIVAGSEETAIFCVHGLAGWIAVGSEEISYMGLQIALAFDLGFLQGYGPPQEIDPLRDRFIGIVIGICIISTVFALIWPESAALLGRERLASSLRAIARLLRLGGANNGSQKSSAEREQLELEIATRLAEANSYSKQAGFEDLMYGSPESNGRSWTLQSQLRSGFMSVVSPSTRDRR